MFVMTNDTVLGKGCRLGVSSLIYRSWQNGRIVHHMFSFFKELDKIWMHSIKWYIHKGFCHFCCCWPPVLVKTGGNLPLILNKYIKIKLENDHLAHMFHLLFETMKDYKFNTFSIFNFYTWHVKDNVCLCLLFIYWKLKM